MTKYRIALIRAVLSALLIVIVFSLFQLFYRGRGSPPGTSDSEVARLIRERIKPTASKTVAGEQLYAGELLERFYKARDYVPAWSHNGRLTLADQLISAAEEVYADGLIPSYYHLDRIKTLSKELGDRAQQPDRLSDLDILLTDSFLALGCHLSGGCVDPVTLKNEWHAKRARIDVPALLQKAVNEGRVRKAIDRVRPEDITYTRLRQGLVLYRKAVLKGEWPHVSAGSPLKPSASSARVLELRKRLAASGDLKQEAAGGDFFDADLEAAVKFFQRRHGLKESGIVDPATLYALNIPLSQRIRQIELNLERLRWTLGNKEELEIVVNIAGFELYVMENGKTVLSMRVVVGKPYWNTPVFTAKMTHIVINPSWNVPDSIAREEILEKVKGDPEYLARQNIKVFAMSGSRQVELDPGSIDWSGIDAKNMIYKFRQEPGPLNALGHFKFVMPNSFDVYLHDTPSKQLFSEAVRTFSHGCTRLEKPVDLAEYLLREDTQWTKDKILAEVEKGTEKTIRITRPINVHFLYLTSWVDEDGVLQFRNDIYGRDRVLDETLRERPTLR